jgi:hypothetical protein
MSKGSLKIDHIKEEYLFYNRLALELIECLDKNIFNQKYGHETGENWEKLVTCKNLPYHSVLWLSKGKCIAIM